MTVSAVGPVFATLALAATMTCVLPVSVSLKVHPLGHRLAIPWLPQAMFVDA